MGAMAPYTSSSNDLPFEEFEDVGQLSVRHSLAFLTRMEYWKVQLQLRVNEVHRGDVHEGRL